MSGDNELRIDEDLDKGLIIGIKPDGGIFFQSFGDINTYEFIGLSKIVSLMADENLADNIKGGYVYNTKRTLHSVQGVLQLLTTLKDSFNKVTDRLTTLLTPKSESNKTE